jgi:hypothetical protein
MISYISPKMSFLGRCNKHFMGVNYECSKMMIGSGHWVQFTGVNDDFFSAIVSYVCKMIISLAISL